MRAIITLAVLATLSLVAVVPVSLGYQLDLGLPRVHEQCNQWSISFEWDGPEGYSRSVSHSTSEAGGIGGQKTSTDTLTLVSSFGFSKIIKVVVTQYPSEDPSLQDFASLSDKALKAASRSGGCRNTTCSAREIDGNLGAFVVGESCKGDGEYYSSVYPLNLGLDKSKKVTTSNTLITFTSTFDRDTTETFLDTVHIDRSV